MNESVTDLNRESDIDIDKARADTPTCRNLVHFNNAGSSLMPTPVFDSVIRHLQLEQEIGGYEAHAQVMEDIVAFYTEFGSLLNASADEIAFIENATRAWDMAFYSLPLQPGDRILTHESEYVSNYLALLQQVERRKLHIDLVPSDEHGQIDLVELQNRITDRTRVIALTHIPTQGGLVNPVEAVGEIAKREGLIYLLDACQSAGQIQLDVKKIQCDLLSGTGRKFLRGPRGTGFLYVRKQFLEQLDPPFVDLHSATWTRDDGFEFQPNATRFENWESFYAGRIGLMQAVRYANQLGLASIEKRVCALGSQLRSTLDSINGVSTLDQGERRCGIVTFNKAGVSAADMKEKLSQHNMNVSVSSFNSARLDFARRNLTDITRASVHYFNTLDEINRFAERVDEI